MIRIKIVVFLSLLIATGFLYKNIKTQKWLLTKDTQQTFTSLGYMPELLRVSLKDSIISAVDYRCLLELLSDVNNDGEDSFNSNTRNKLKTIANEREIIYSKWQNNASIFNSIYNSFSRPKSISIDKSLTVNNIKAINSDSTEVELLYINNLKLDKNIFFREKQRMLDPKEIKSFDGELRDVNVKLINPISGDSLIVKYLIDE